MSADLYAARVGADGQTSWRMVSDSEELTAGEALATAPPVPTMADAAATLTIDVQAWLDATAGGNGYDSIASCISYRGSSIAQWNADADAALAWRDAVWQDCFQWQQDALANPPATFPTSADVIAQLPQPETFGWVTHQPGATA